MIRSLKTLSIYFSIFIPAGSYILEDYANGKRQICDCKRLLSSQQIYVVWGMVQSIFLKFCWKTIECLHLDGISNRYTNDDNFPVSTVGR